MLENPDDEFDIEQHLVPVSEIEYAQNPTGYRDVCWDLKVALRLSPKFQNYQITF